MNEINEVLVEFFVNLTKLGRDCEVSKQLMNEKLDFEPYAVFSRIDRLSKGYIDHQDLVNFLKDNEFFVTHKNLKGIDLFIEYYDRNFDSKIKFDEFLIFILNKTNSIVRATSTQRKTFKLNYKEYLSNDLEDAISKLLLKEIHLFEWVDKKKVELFMNKFDLIDIFVEIDIDKDGFIKFDDLEKFLRSKEIILYREEIKSVISLYDEDLDGRLNWNEFLFMILPSKKSYDYDYVWLREMENEHMKIYYETLRIKKLKKDNSIENLNHTLILSNSEFQKPNYLEEFYYAYNKNNLSNKNYNSNSVTRDYSIESEYNYNLELFISDIYNLLQIDKDVENIKIKLSKNLSFNLISIFKFFDKFKFDYITFDTFVDGVEYFTRSYNRNLKEIELLFQKYDQYHDNKIK